MLVKTNEPDRGVLGQRDIDVTLDVAAGAALAPLISLYIVTSGKRGWSRFVRDDAQCSRKGACAIQRALWTRECFDARNVIYVQVDRTCDRGHRQLIQIQAAGGQG